MPDTGDHDALTWVITTGDVRSDRVRRELLLSLCRKRDQTGVVVREVGEVGGRGAGQLVLTATRARRFADEPVNLTATPEYLKLSLVFLGPLVLRCSCPAGRQLTTVQGGYHWRR
jgi:hypothetical protein